MARKYARDKRGRFSSTGATARGGRLGGSGKGGGPKKVKVAAGKSLDRLKTKASEGRLNAGEFGKLKSGLRAAGQYNRFMTRNEAAGKRAPSDGGKIKRTGGKSSSLMAAAARGRAAGRAKGEAMAAKAGARNRALDAKANSMGGKPGRGEGYNSFAGKRKTMGSAPKAAAQKAAFVKRVSGAALSGKGKVSSAAKGYVKAQQANKVNEAAKAGGKGNAARRRMRK